MENRLDFSGDRLRIARTFAGLSQVDLGQQVGITHASISQAENGLRQPSADVVEKLASALHFSVSYFYLKPPPEFRDEECRFRRRKTTPMGVRNRVLAAGTLFAELIELLDELVSLPPYSVPTIRVKSVEDIERAAEQCRKAWDLRQDAPIKNVARTMERQGAVIGRFAASAGKIDAFSRCDTRGVIVLNTDKGSTSRARHDVAHECGHLVMHAGLDAADELEAQADRFASAFLLPRTAFIREFPRVKGYFRLEALLPLKSRWLSSLAAIIRRAFDLKLLSPSQYQQAFKQYYARHFHKGEPLEPPEEKSETVKLAFEFLEEQGHALADLLAALGWTPDVLARIAPDAYSPTIDAAAPTRTNVRFLQRLSRLP